MSDTTDEHNIALELAEQSLNLSKKMFAAFTGQELSFAKELISLEERISALKNTELNAEVDDKTQTKTVVKETVKEKKTEVVEQPKSEQKGNAPSIDDVEF